MNVLKNKSFLVFSFLLLLLGVNYLTFTIFCNGKKSPIFPSLENGEKSTQKPPVVVPQTPSTVKHPSKIPKAEKSNTWTLAYRKESKLIRSHLVHFIHTGNCKESVAMYYSDKSRDKFQYFLYDDLLTFLMFIECKNYFSLSRIGDGELMIMRGTRVPSAINNEWRWDKGVGWIGRELKKHLGTSKDTYIGVPCMNWLAELPTLRKGLWNTKFRMITTTLIWQDANWTMFMKWFKAKVIKRKLKLDKVILIANKAYNSQIDKLKKWVDVFKETDNKLMKNFEDEKFRNEFLGIVKGYAKKYKNSLFLISCGPLAALLPFILREVNPNNFYLDMGSAIDPITKGKQTRGYQNSNSHFSKKSCGRYTKDAKLMKYEGTFDEMQDAEKITDTINF